tara:strand:+ start:641 stop:1000 length:360 start_codon:yes stop_codon:yes gene_type:complete
MNQNKTPIKMACLHYSHELKDRAHELLNVDFKKGSQLAIFNGIIDYLQSNKDLALKVAQHVQLFMPKTQTPTQKATKSLARQSKGMNKKQLEQQQKEIMNTMKTTNPELFAVMFPDVKE